MTAVRFQLTRLGSGKIQVQLVNLNGDVSPCEVDPLYNKRQLQAVRRALDAGTYDPMNDSWRQADSDWQALKNLGLADDHGFTDLQKRVGSALFERFFPIGALRVELLKATSVSYGPRPQPPVRVEFRFATPDLGVYPWELLCDMEQNRFLFSGPSAVLVRYISYSKKPPRLSQSDRLTILLVSAKPKSRHDDPLRLPSLSESQNEPVTESLREAIRQGSVQIHNLPQASSTKSTWDLLNDCLQHDRDKSMPNVLHFDGHGDFGRLCLQDDISRCRALNDAEEKECGRCNRPLEREAEGYLAFEWKDRSPDWISATSLGNLLVQKGLSLVVLMACKTAEFALRGSSLFTSVAPAIIQAGVPAVVGTQFSISDDCARDFEKHFYGSLEQFDPLTVAMAKARVDLFQNHPNEWYKIVLYLRTDEKNLEGRLLRTKRPGDKRVPSESIGKSISQFAIKKRIDELVLEVRQDNSLQATLKCEGEIEPPVEEPAILQKDRETIRDSVGLLKRKELDGKADLLIRLGEDLYTALFPMKIGSLFERALRDVQKANIPDKTTTRSLRVVFDVHPESTVARDSWPLELLRYHDQEKWLAAATDITLARLIKTEGSPIKVEKTPLRVLLVASLPTSSNLRGVITADLVKAIAKVSTRGAAGQGNPLEVKVLGCIPEGEQIGGIDYPGHHATWQALQEMAEQGWQPQVLHFIGHGELSGSHGQVTLEGENGTEFSVSAEDLYDSLLQEWGPLVVLLQACENAREGTEAALVKVADYLAGHGIPAAVAMQLSVTNNQATLFAKGFYEALVQGEDIEKAVSIGRQSILKSTLSHSPAFASPVLFSSLLPVIIVAPAG